MHTIIPAIILLFLSLSIAGCLNNDQEADIYFVCNESNDLFRLLENNHYTCHRHENIEHALEQIPGNGKLLVLARNYPDVKTSLPENFYEETKAKNLKVYVEFPDRLPSDPTGEIKSTKKERLIITSDFFGEALPSTSILDAGLYSYVDVSDRVCHIKGANVAGFNKVVYGLANTPNSPILFQEDHVLISTTKISDFIKSRYSPKSSWVHALAGILSYLDVELENGSLNWKPIVRPAFTKNEPLTADAYQNAVKQGAAWYRKGRFLIHPEWKAKWRGIDTLPLPVGPPMDLDFPSGDGSLGVMEGHYSYINPDGSQG